MIGQYRPIDFAFCDTLHGILLCVRNGRGPDNLFAFGTSDGGKSWDLRSNSAIKYLQDDVWTLDAFQSAKDGFGSIDLDIPEQEVGINSDTIASYLVRKPYHTHTFGQKMYSVSDGYRYICKIDSTGVLANESFMIVTHDGWRSYDSAGRFLKAWIDDATILDSNNIWVTHGDSVFHYFEGSWHAIRPDASLPQSVWGHTECGPKLAEGLQEIYEVGGRKSDFYYSPDDGFTWERHDAFAGRLFGISATAPHTLWCFVGNGLGPRLIEHYSDLRIFQVYADTLYYSSDHGNSWSVDSTSFSGAAMMQMHWVDPRHGFVSTVEFGDTCFMYRYEAPPVAAVGTQLPRASALKILTSPVMQQLAFDYTDAEGVSNIRVFDVLGRTRLSEQRAIAAEQPVRIDASALTSGYYILSVSNGKRTTSQGFIKQ
jgi:hypothetical protein